MVDEKAAVRFMLTAAGLASTGPLEGVFLGGQEHLGLCMGERAIHSCLAQRHEWLGGCVWASFLLGSTLLSFLKSVVFMVLRIPRLQVVWWAGSSGSGASRPWGSQSSCWEGQRGGFRGGPGLGHLAREWPWTLHPP